MICHRVEHALEQIELALPETTPIEALCLVAAQRALQHALTGSSNDIDPKLYYTVGELSSRWDTTENSVRYHINQGNLKGQKLMGSWLVNGRDVVIFEMRRKGATS